MLVVMKLVVVILAAPAPVPVSAAAASILNYYASFLTESVGEMRTKVRNAVVIEPVLRVSVRELHGSRSSSVRFLAVRFLDDLL